MTWQRPAQASEHGEVGAGEVLLQVGQRARYAQSQQAARGETALGQREEIGREETAGLQVRGECEAE